MVSVPARRQQVAYGRGRGLSARRACTLFSVARSALEYSQPERREGCACGHADEGAVGAVSAVRLSAHPHFPQPRRPSHEPRPGAPAVANGKAAGAAQAAEEAHSRCAAATPASTEWAEPGLVLRLRVRPLRQWLKQLKRLTVADEFTKEGLAIDVDGRIRSGRVIEALSRLVSARGAPRFLRSDNGPEFVSKALLSRIVTQGIGTALIEPGKPWQNGVAESFNGKFRDECRSPEWFRSRAEAKVLIEEWRRHFNEVRPHSSLDISRRRSSWLEEQGQRPAMNNGPGRYGIWGLRAPARCSTVPAGTNAASKGGRLKLTVVRRTWAGHLAVPVIRFSSMMDLRECVEALPRA